MNKTNRIFLLIPIVLIADMLLISPLINLMKSPSPILAFTGFLSAFLSFGGNMFFIRKVISKLE